MNWEIRYRLFRDKPLTDEERDSLLKHVRRCRDGIFYSFDLNLPRTPRQDGLIAMHSVDMYYSDAHDSDVPKLLQALTTLRDLVPGASMEVWDSFELVAWNIGLEKFDTMGSNDVPRFDLPATDDTFWGLGGLDYDHRFTTAKVSHSASRIEPDALAEQIEGPIKVSGDPVFVTEERYSEKRLCLATWVKRTGPVPVNIERVEAVLLTDSNDPIDCDWDIAELLVQEEARLVVDVPGHEAVHKIASSVSLTAQVREQFDHTLGDWTLDRDTAPPAMTLVASVHQTPSSWPVRVALGGYIDPNKSDRSWRLIVEVQALTPSYKATGDLTLDFLDDQGRTIATDGQRVHITTDPCRFATSLWHSAHELDSVTRIALRGTFEVTRHLSLGTWKLP